MIRKNKYVTAVSLDLHLVEKLRVMAKADNRSLSNMINTILRERVIEKFESEERYKKAEAA